MLKRTLKLLKYDLRAMVKYWWVIALITPIAALVTALLLRSYIETMELMDSMLVEEETVFGSLMLLLLSMGEMLGAYVSSIIFGVTLLATEIVIFIRFFKHFYTDEGYLTFTLPVSRRELYFSKVISAMIITLAQVAIMVLGAVAMILIVPPSDAGLWIFAQRTWEVIGNWIRNPEFWKISALLLVNGAIGIVVAVGSLFTEITLIHMCITLGSVIAKRGKVFAAIGCWFLISNAFSYILSGLYTALYSMLIVTLPFALELTIYHFLFGCIPLLVMIAAIFWTFGFLFYNITQALIDKKLNLA